MTSSYDAIASWYDRLVRPDSRAGARMLQHLFELIGPVSDQQICDLACGQGHLARKLAQVGAHVIGVDLSSVLIAIARQEETSNPLAITYMVDDATTLTTLADAW